MNLFRRLGAHLARPDSALLLAIYVTCSWQVSAAEPDGLAIILELLHSPDRDTRGLALQQVREGIPGESVTSQLTQQLPSLDPEGQAALLEALGDRGDLTARPAVLKAVSSPSEIVRLAALAALPALAKPVDVSVLVTRAAQGSPLEQQTARRGLVRLRGDGMNKALISLLDTAMPNARVEILAALAARRVSDAMPKVLECAANADAVVRLAAIAAAQALAQPPDTEALIKLTAAYQTDPERAAAEGALLAVSGRGRERCLVAVLGAMVGASARTRVVLLQALAAIGGPKALQKVCECVPDEAPTVGDEAVRILSEWPEPEAESCLLQVAEQPRKPLHQVLALRGLVRLASAEQPVDLPLLRKVWQWAKRPEDKGMVLGALSASATPESLEFAAQALEVPGVSEDAALAAVRIAEKLQPLSPASRQAIERAREHTQDPAVRGRAEKLLTQADGVRHE